MNNDKTCYLPEKEELKVLLRDINNIVWYSRCPEVEGSDAAKRYLKSQIKKFKKEKEKKNNGKSWNTNL